MKWIILLVFGLEAYELSTNTFDSCSNNSAINLQKLSLDIDDSKNILTVKIDADVKKNIPNANANINLLLFGQSVYNFNLNLCTQNSQTNLCPIKEGSFNYNNTVQLPTGSSTASNVLNKVPGSPLQANVKIVDDQGNELSCTNTSVSSSSTLSQTGVKVGTLVMIGFSGLLTGISNMMGDGGGILFSAGPTPSVLDLMSYCQFVASTGQLSLDSSDTYLGFTKNFAWYVGAINVPGFQTAYNKLTKATWNSSGPNLVKRDTSLTSTNGTSGLARFSSSLNILPQNYFLTVLILVLLVMAALTVLSVLLRLLLEGLSYWKPKLFMNLRNHFILYYIGNLIRIFMIGYFAISVAAFYQLVIHDNWLTTVVAAFILAVFCIFGMIFVTVKLWRAGREKLMTDVKLNYTYGSLYSDYRIALYLFFVPFVLYQIIRAAAIGLFVKKSLVQLIIVAVNEVLYFLALFLVRPYAKKIANNANIFISLLRIINVAILFLFLETISLNSIAQVVISWILIAIQILSLLCYLIILLWSTGSIVRRFFNRKSNGDKNKPNDVVVDGLPPVGSPSIFSEQYLNQPENSSLNRVPTFLRKRAPETRNTTERGSFGVFNSH